MEELWTMHYARFVNSIENANALKPPPKYDYFRESNFFKHGNFKNPNKIIIFHGRKYKRGERSKEEELAIECNINVQLFKKIKQEVFPAYIREGNL
jgi:hypothetical protein